MVLIPGTLKLLLTVVTAQIVIHRPFIPAGQGFVVKYRLPPARVLRKRSAVVGTCYGYLNAVRARTVVHSSIRHRDFRLCRRRKVADHRTLQPCTGGRPNCIRVLRFYERRSRGAVEARRAGKC
ncbi:hypothetical protein B0H17DRAFT_163018 [Mycena rosella]|uniref:Secreted protein n=1 Tax=Mycena rosella TaxID=1033263 RepID=A0AAD7D164_MYCRO|nr:hypothetical protein B0H17DRAFT_163018 [Mycena rosella]